MDEEDRIGQCITSADFADEIILVDSHSTDRTREIAAGLGARVIERDWAGYVAQKNYCIDQASNEWVLVLDADEWLDAQARASVIAALTRADAPDGFELNRCTQYMGRWIRHGGWYPDRKLRLFRKSVGRFQGIDPHDRVRVAGRVERLAGDILHHPFRSIADHLRTIDRYTSIAADEKHARGQRAGHADLTLRPCGKFLRMYFLERGFLEGIPGFVIAVTGSFYVFLKYAKLWEQWVRRGEGRRR
jgi:glycosyltransferase involved in cell wall biosynthesis